MSSQIITSTQLNSKNIDLQCSPIEPIKKVVPITPQRFRIEDQIEQPTFYLLEAKAGQTINFWGESGTITAELFFPSGQLLSHFVLHQHQNNQWQGSLSESGLYRVLVCPHPICAAFTIKISLSDG